MAEQRPQGSGTGREALTVPSWHLALKGALRAWPSAKRRLMGYSLPCPLWKLGQVT